MKQILIGSTALKYHFPDLPREPKDVDCAIDGYKKNEDGVEYLHNPIVLEISEDSIISAEHLLTLKMSHIFWDLNWEKHIYDILFLQDKGVKFDRDLFYRFYEFFEDLHKNPRSDLKMTADDFFNNALVSEYDHDYIHTIIAPIPAYTLVLKDGSEVEPCESKFNAMAYKEKLALVQEEVMVMSWERYKNQHYLHAYYKMLKKFIISHAPLWEAIWILQNFNALYKAPFNYNLKINNELQTNK